MTTLDEISSLISSWLAPEPKAPGLNTSIQALDYNTDEQLLDQWQARFPQYTSF